MKTSFVISLLFLSFATRAQFLSITNGDWDDPSTWSTGTVPGWTDSVFVRHVVHYHYHLRVDSGGYFHINKNGKLCGDFNLRSTCLGTVVNLGIITGDSITLTHGLNDGKIYALTQYDQPACHSINYPALLTVGIPYYCFPLGEDEVAGADGLSVFPNPVSDYLDISTTCPDALEFILYDMNSLLITRTPFRHATTVSTADLPHGIYIYEVRKKDGPAWRGKIIK